MEVKDGRLHSVYHSRFSFRRPARLLDRSKLEGVIMTHETPQQRDEPWPDPTPEMLNGDPLFDAIWNVIKSWDIAVPEAYSGYTGGTGNHARAIYDAIRSAPPPTPSAPRS